MQDDGKRLRRPEPDFAMQRTVLALVFSVFPILCTVPELGREIGSRHAVERAAGTLEVFGLLECRGETLLPTPAALLCHRLDAW